jgi:hypothetical protein
MPSLQSLAKNARLGTAAYHLWHRPTSWIRDIVRAGGPFEQRRTETGRRHMEDAALHLPVLTPQPGPAISVSLLTGARFWYQTAFCLWTLSRESGRALAPIIYDDGSLTGSNRDALLRSFPLATFVSKAESIDRLDAHLPVSRFPVLRERWINYPHIRKITDPHLHRSGWRLVIDSDLLFLRRPDYLLGWLDKPERPLHALDCETSYGYPRPLMDKLAGRPVADLVNVGLAGLNSGEINWERLESWCRQLIEQKGASYYLEQALVAMMVAGRPCDIAPGDDYVTLPRMPEARDCRAVMHHYVAESKRWYFQENWRRALETRP